jgi:diaminopimelate epimerase
MTMHVVKMHGARNDFVLVDARKTPVNGAANLARRLCDRRSGIGADGLLLVEPSSTGDVKMRIVNADGSEAEMCGNGIRCFARYMDEEGEGGSLGVETLSGIVQTRIVSRTPEYLVRVALPAPVIQSRNDDAYVIRVGNLHVVLLRDSVEDFDLERAAKEFQKQFADGVNVHVACIVNDHAVRTRPWERGVGFTQACGTGTAACVVAAAHAGRVNSPVDVEVPGGRLTIEWNDHALYMIGPAARVFETEIAVPA